jgi:hypothetical protein
MGLGRNEGFLFPSKHCFDGHDENRWANGEMVLVENAVVFKNYLDQSKSVKKISGKEL